MKYAYYNEFDPKAAAWLRELIKAGLIAPGIVDERSIEDVTPNDLRGFAQCHFFAGIGGWSYALRLAGWSDDRPIWTGSPPCQPFSVAGKRKAQSDARHLWPVFFNLIRECQPAVIFGEQVEAAIRTGWLDDLQDDLEAENYATGKIVLPACSVGAPHIRQRIWFVAERMADADRERSQRYGRFEQKHDSERRQEPVRLCGAGGESGGLADTTNDGHAAPDGLRETTEPPQQTWAQNIGQSSGGSDNRGVAESNNDRRGAGEWNDQATGHGNTFASESDANRHEPADAPDGFWRAADWLWCRDGKWRPVAEYNRLAIKPYVFGLLSDGLSSILESGWNESYEKTKKEVDYYAKKANVRPGEILRTMWGVIAEKTIWQNAGRQGEISSQEVLLVALLKLQRDSLTQFDAATHDFSKDEETVVRALWRDAGAKESFARSSYKRRLDRPFNLEPDNALYSMPPKTAQKEQGAMQRMQETSEGAWPLPEALSKVEKIWRSAFDSEGGRARLRDCQDWGFGLSLHPLSPKIPCRAILLRGYGNAIVPQMAAQIIKSYMEILL